MPMFTSKKLFCIYVCAGPFIVGFAKTTYTVIEDDGQVEVCVDLISEEDVGDGMVLIEVNSNEDPGSIPTDGAPASKLA